MAWRRRGVAAVASGVLLVAACGDDGRAGAARSTTSVEAERATAATTAATATTTTATVPAIEPPANTGTDMVAILQSLTEFGNRLGMAPSIEAVELAYHPGSPAYERAVEITRALLDHGYRWSGPTEQLTDIVDNGALDGRTWLLSAVSASRPEVVLLDSQGQPVADQPEPAPPARYVYSLVRGDDGRWRIGEVQYLAPAS